jgi:hypothetical protein
MPLTDRAYWPADENSPTDVNGEPLPYDLPRCTATPGKADVAANRAMRRDTWECALPEGHEEYDNPRHRPHSWVQTGEDH